MSIRFGACIGIDLDKLTALRDCGYSYAETSLSAVAGLSDSEFDSFLNSAKNAGIPIEACNGFFPADIKIVGDSVDYDLVAAYTKRALARASALGVRVAVLGSAKSRAVPDGFDRKTAEEQFVTALRVCGDIAAACGIGIAIEPLRTGECNFVNTVAEGLELCARADHPAVGCLADFYHVFMNGESMDAVAHSNGRLIHTHIARANADRLYPHSPEDEAACRVWAQALRDCGYRGRMSLEGRSGDDFAAMIQKAKEYLNIFNA